MLVWRTTWEQSRRVAHGTYFFHHFLLLLLLLNPRDTQARYLELDHAQIQQLSSHTYLYESGAADPANSSTAAGRRYRSAWVVLSTPQTLALDVQRGFIRATDYSELILDEGFFSSFSVVDQNKILSNNKKADVGMCQTPHATPLSWFHLRRLFQDHAHIVLFSGTKDRFDG